MIYLFDLCAEFWRNYYGCGLSAAQAIDLTTERISWYHRENPRTIVCCDSPKSWRRDIEPTYKATRKPKPPDAIEALVFCENWCERNRIPLARAEGFEADDLIATFCRQAGPEEVRIVGTEKDFYCLISDSVKLVGRAGEIGFAGCVEKWGVTPEQMTDFLAMVGDDADNVKGCDNCGAVRVATLLDRFGSIDAIKRASDEQLLEVKRVGKLTVAAIRAWDPELSLQLVRLRTDAPASLDDLLEGTT